MELAKESKDAGAEKRKDYYEQIQVESLKELEHEYMAEMEKMINAKENRKYFNDARMKKVGIEIHKLELKLRNNNFNTKKASCNYVSNSTISSNTIKINKPKEENINNKLKSQIPIPIKKKNKVKYKLIFDIK